MTQEPIPSHLSSSLSLRKSPALPRVSTKVPQPQRRWSHFQRHPSLVYPSHHNAACGRVDKIRCQNCIHHTLLHPSHFIFHLLLFSSTCFFLDFYHRCHLAWYLASSFCILLHTTSIEYSLCPPRLGPTVSCPNPYTRVLAQSRTHLQNVSNQFLHVSQPTQDLRADTHR